MIKILNTKQIVELYGSGFFPMAESQSSEKINFYKPEKRFIIPIDNFHIPKKLFNEYRKKKFIFKINTNFSYVIDQCSKPRKNESESWINQIIKNSYYELYREGYGKSIECYNNNKIIAGLYGLKIGSCFFGESMFGDVSNSSKLCLLFLISILKKNNFNLLDSQFYNPHLLQFGSYEIYDSEYQKILKKNINKNCFFPHSFNYDESISILQFLSHKS